MQNIPGGKIMKTFAFALTGVAFVLTSCGSSRYASSSEYDDVYYSPNQVETQATAPAMSQPGVTPQQAMEAQAVPQPSYNAGQEIALEPIVEENLSDYERYRLKKEAEMLGETYSPEEVKPSMLNNTGNWIPYNSTRKPRRL
ncbi:MAG: hypothetical protein R2751_15465 [Bacteroidales bacterium]